MVSIIIPVFNSAQTITKCINSIIAQSYTDWELLLIDDGSTDPSGKICDEYSKTYPNIYSFHQTNGGVSSARNLGINKANGEYILFVDADDWIEKDYIQSYLNEAKYDLVVGTLTYESKEDNTGVKCPEIQCNRKEQIGEAINKLDSYMGMTVPWCKLFRTDIIRGNQICFDEMTSSGEDTLFVYQYLLYINSFCSTNNTSPYHYIVNSGLSTKKLEICSIIYTIEKIIRSLNDLQLQTNYNPTFREHQIIQNFISKYDVTGKSITKLYQDIKILFSHKFAYDMINDNRYIPKGSIRKSFDFLAKHGLYLTLALFCKMSGRFYK